MTKQSRARLGTVGAASALLTAAVVLAAPLAASAHVHVDPATAVAGGYATLTFKVPNESETASTNRIEVDLPTDTPFTSVSYQPVPGWSAEVIEGPLPEPITVGDATLTTAPLSVVWTADDGVGIVDGQFQEFPISVGPVPDTDDVVLPAHQGYTDGSVVDWADAPLESGEEPEHPAPVLVIDRSADEAAGHGAHGGGADAAADTAGGGGDVTATAAAASEGPDPLSLGLGIGGFGLGAIALVVAVVALLRRPADEQSRTEVNA
ncbi:YcnI family protein [Herbiconiux sp. CPCC 203407]|uniref:YcnI family protein n=1 Tax=Herbiconiux oxytropis TaxID=2970915 RepID=A0AA41XBX6_9MICO|nr:YcnI family protein [Herbiconiux oxytropis]MCS5722981.1 YcnI family protein [Herbiconiux oxytropis]MCS5725207.1 YcnI family protein [Herbiconiux oxytropis]